ncbi:uncharacterized protein Dwil_GK15103 [Drosophila willistoni]|uniref:DUF4774 domain-containing protein n=1 Tax=Drosophila willistoni TaxID=7260 RepID=B4MVM4_DROWI|nr:uncharacterized protein LOC6642265 [Drosophila willistoni]EDW75744.1 uncharacterized protein Dwil_GK15103 [Drosophila willistoni]
MKQANLLVSCVCLLIFGLEITLAYSASPSTNYGGPSESLIKQAKELGIEANILTELWNSKQPVIVTKPDALGQLKKTTYALTSDNSGITKTDSTEYLPTHVEQSPQQNSQQSPQQSSQQSPQQDWEYLPPTQTRRVISQTYLPGSSFGTNFGGNYGANWPDFGSGFPSLSHNWPSFSFPAGAVPETSTKTEVDDQGRTVTTTTKIFRSNGNPNQAQPNFFNQPWPNWQPPQAPARPESGTNVDQAGLETTTIAGIAPTYVPLPTVASTNPGVKTTTPFPPLDEFIRSRNTPPTLFNTDVDDLPTVDDQGVPIFNNVPSTQTHTRVTTYTSNFNGDAARKIANLDPSARDMLARAGITEEDIQNAPPSGIIEKTRTEPDGRVVTTRVRVSSSPKPPSEPLPPLPTVKPYQTSISIPTKTNSDTSIENYLSQVNLSPEDILAQNGEVVKTIVDKDGRVLSARFVLSTIKGSENQQELPTK